MLLFTIFITLFVTFINCQSQSNSNSTKVLKDPAGFELPNKHKGTKGTPYIEKLLDSQDQLADFLICANIIHTKRAEEAMKLVQKYIKEQGFDEEKGTELYMKVFITSSMKCGKIFRNLTRDTQMHYLNYTLETKSRDHLNPFFQVDIE